MAVRLAILATLFCVGCSTALPDSAPVKEAGAPAASKEQPAAKKETAEAPSAPDKKEAAAGEKEEGKEKEEEVKGHVTVQWHRLRSEPFRSPWTASAAPNFFQRI